jgi:hypothetical protein
MHPNHVLALAHQHHADLLAAADHRRIVRWARLRRRPTTRRDPVRWSGDAPVVWGTSPPATGPAM